jgi:hypothetical protein
MKIRIPFSRVSVLVIALCMSNFPCFASNVSVPSLDLITRGAMENGNFVLHTVGQMNMVIEGGYKFGGQIMLGFDSQDIESQILNVPTGGLYFRAASVEIKDLFGIPLSLMYFIGRIHNLCLGDGFSKLLATTPVSISYSGFMYFPTGPVYNGIHTIGGTGMNISFTPVPNVLYLGLYAYQDSYLSELFSPGRYSYDLRALLDLGIIRFESFIGASYPAENYGYYRAGLLFYAQGGPAEFITQLGIPKWDPVVDQFGIELFYLLFEVRVNLGIVSIIPTVFLHPKYYLQKQTNEAGYMDLNINLRFGNLEEGIFTCGVEGNFAFKQELIQALQVKTAAYINFATPGAIWTFKCNIKLFGDPSPWTDPSNMFEGFLGIQAEF